MAAHTNQIDAGAGEHLVRFYEDDAQLVRTAGPYLGEALRSGAAAVVIATDSHRVVFEAFLRGEGIDVDAAFAEQRLICLDAATTMRAFINEGAIDASAFHALVGGLMRCAGESGRMVHAYGEMVALLWDAGDVLAAIELERLWNELGDELPFSLLCAYPAASMQTTEFAGATQHVCELHSAVLDERDQHAPSHESTLASDGVFLVHLPAERESPGDARRLLAAALRECGCERALIDAAALVLSELASNAVRHVGSPFAIEARIEHDTLCLAVEDQSPPSRAAMIVRRTHGLGVISTLAESWGVQDAPQGKLVWARLPLTAPRAQADKPRRAGRARR